MLSCQEEFDEERYWTRGFAIWLQVGVEFLVSGFGELGNKIVMLSSVCIVWLET